VHMSPEDAAFYGVKDRELMALKVYGDCPLTFEDVLCRVAKGLRLEVHIDTDEGNACGLEDGVVCELVKKAAK